MSPILLLKAGLKVKAFSDLDQFIIPDKFVFIGGKGYTLLLHQQPCSEGSCLQADWEALPRCWHCISIQSFSAGLELQSG